MVGHLTGQKDPRGRADAFYRVCTSFRKRMIRSRGRSVAVAICSSTLPGVLKNIASFHKKRLIHVNQGKILLSTSLGKLLPGPPTAAIKGVGIVQSAKAIIVQVVHFFSQQGLSLQANDLFLGSQIHPDPGRNPR